MSKLTKTSDAAQVGADPQVINPANNLPVVEIDDNTTTKSDAKGAGTSAQVENAELAEMNKAKTIQALRQHFADFKPAGVAFDEVATRAGLKAAGLNDDVINVTIKQLAKKAAETITVDEFITHINNNTALYYDVLNYCGRACLDRNNLVLDNQCVIYHSDDSDNCGYIETKVTDEISYFEERATITVSNLIKSVQTYSIKRNTIGKSIVIKSDSKLSLDTFDKLTAGIVKLGTVSTIELITRLAYRHDSGLESIMNYLLDRAPLQVWARYFSIKYRKFLG